MTRVLITGGRDYDDWAMFRRAMIDFGAEQKISLIIHGGASGADRMAADFAAQRGIACARVDAHWRTLGRKAGPVRNSWMIDLLKPDAVIAFPGGDGTADCIRRAGVANVPVHYYGNATKETSDA